MPQAAEPPGAIRAGLPMLKPGGWLAFADQQALNIRARGAPGVTDLVLNPDAHAGYGAPVGCVLTSPTHIYPGPVGVDIKCSMSFLQLDLPADQVAETPGPPRVHRCHPRTHADRRGSRPSVPRAKPAKSAKRSVVKVVTEGASAEVLHALGIPLEWAQRCEDAVPRRPRRNRVMPSRRASIG